jgi:hypothetical protein
VTGLSILLSDSLASSEPQPLIAQEAVIASRASEVLALFEVRGRFEDELLQTDSQ